MSSKAVILVAEDDLEDQSMLQEFLTENGIISDQVKYFVNGKLLLDYLATDNMPKLIVLDLNMPVLNGTKTLLAIKSNPQCKQIPVIIYSTSNNEEEQRKCISFGASEFIVKPSTMVDGEQMTKKFISYL